MDWDPKDLANPRGWWVDDPRWLGRARGDEWDALFGARPWVAPRRLNGWHATETVDGIVTADLLYDAAARLYAMPDRGSGL